MNAIADPILRVDHMTMRFGGLVAVDDVSFSVARGTITALIGPNGAGKTTLFNCITGFYKPSAGRIALSLAPGAHDERIDALTRTAARFTGDLFLLERMADHEIARRAKVARTFQNIRLFPGMSVLENLIVAQHTHLMAASRFSLAGLAGTRAFRNAEADGIALAAQWLERIGLTDRADDAAGALPYGAQRKLEIARAMCTNPALLCLDEPAAGLNPRESGELNALLRTIRSEHDVTILLIEHDMSVVMEISDHIIVLDHGCKIADAAPAFIRNDPQVIAAYLGVPDDDLDTVAQEIPVAGLAGGAPH